MSGLALSGNALIAMAVFALVILAIAANLLDMTLAAMLGVSVLTVSGVVRGTDIMPAIQTAGPTLALLGAGMVLVRILTPTGLFERSASA